MAFNPAERAAFYINADQMGLAAATVTALAAEGIDNPADLIEFEEEGMRQVAENLRRPPGRIQDPNPPAANPNATIPTPPFAFGAKSQGRLLVMSDLMRFYQAIGRPITPANVLWVHIGENFKEQWKAIKDSKKDTQPEVPLISKGLPILKWIEAFQDHLHRCPGSRFVALAYVTREMVAVPAPVPDLEVDQPYSTLHGSIQGDLINRASHTHGLFAKDNAEVYFKLEEATRGTAYADSIKPFQRTKNGRAGFLAITSQFAGTDKWESEVRRATAVLTQRKWKSNQNSPLEKFIAAHRNAYVSLQVCAEHVEYQLPTGHSRVGYVLDAIESDDAPLQAAMAGQGKRGPWRSPASTRPQP